ncbi:MAG: AAA family ATPase [Myxococcales bacterium]|nr:AAA family ATPase [Myxococcales bacterium]
MPFPHAVRSFAGRRAELDRLIAHVESDVLFFVYGLAGIGKTELVYQLVEELRARPRWAEASPVLVQVAPDATSARLLAQVLAAVGSAPVQRRGQPTEEGQLERLARRLDAQPFLLVLDDVHQLPAPAAAEALGYLSRHVQASRIIVASRRAIALPADARSPVVTTLGPLDRTAAVQMMEALAERLQIPRPDPEGLLRATHCSPFHIQRLLAHPQPGESSLDASLDELTPAARDLLRAIAIARHAVSLATLRRISETGRFDELLCELAERFLVDRDGEGLGVNGLVREVLLGRATPGELVAAHAVAADLCLVELATAPDPPAFLAADAVHHALAAGRPTDAWHVVERWHAALAAAGTEQRLFEILEGLREALPERRVAIDLLIARCLLRASRFDAAASVLARVGDPRGADEACFNVISGEVALRAGERARAAELFDRAAACAGDAAARFDAKLRRASVSILDGDGPGAREQIAAVLAELPSPTTRHEARAGWVRAASWMFDEVYEEAAEEAARAAAALPPRGMDDLANQLAMFETLAAIECEDMPRARAASRRIDEAGLRGRVAAMFRAIVRYADGDARAAGELAVLHTDLVERGDSLNAYLAGYHGSAALAEIGSLGRAQVLADQTAQLAERRGLYGMAARSLAQQAMLAAEAVQAGLAHRLAELALARPHLGPRSRAVAHCAHARAYTLEGDTTLALEHVQLARAAVAAPALAAPRAAVDIEHVAVDLAAGNLDSAISRGERVVERQGGRPYKAAHARLVLAAAYIARGRRTDLVYAQRTLAETRELADRGELRAVQVGCAILSAALARRGNRDRAARELLAEALRELDPERGSIYAGTLLAAIDGGVVARLIPGAVALLGHLGFTETVDCYLVDAQARRAATEKDVARESTARELFVDELRDVIVARRGDVEIRGRPMLCALLSVLVQAGGAAVTPDALYTRVWGVAEYHPLQHRNALYVAINRLRSSLREVFPERDVIERAAAGWRLADGVDACAAVPVRAPAKTM